MSRSQWKLPYIASNLLLKKKQSKGYFVQSIWSRDSSITSKFLNKKVNIHNGREFRYLHVTVGHIGFKFGQFIFTRNFTRTKKQFLKKKNGTKSKSN